MEYEGEDEDEYEFQEEEEWEKLLYMSEESLSRFELEFPKEKCFPILLLSYVRPQHGRLFCASLNRRQLVIRQSKLYSFEKRATAPLDFFSQMLLSQPIQQAKATHEKPHKKRGLQDDKESRPSKVRKVSDKQCQRS